MSILLWFRLKSPAHTYTVHSKKLFADEQLSNCSSANYFLHILITCQFSISFYIQCKVSHVTQSLSITSQCSAGLRGLKLISSFYNI